jgi:hypothetical protein
VFSTSIDLSSCTLSCTVEKGRAPWAFQMLHTLSLPLLLNYSGMPLDGISRGETQFSPGSEAAEDIPTSRDFKNLMSCDIYNFITLTSSRPYCTVFGFYLCPLVLTQPCFGTDTRDPYCCPTSISLAIFCRHSVLIIVTSNCSTLSFPPAACGVVT